MSQKIMTAKGLLTAPGKGNDNDNTDEQMELTNDDKEALLEESEDEVECSQRTPEVGKACQNCRIREEPQRFNRKRNHSETLSPEEKIANSEEAIKSLK